MSRHSYDSRAYRKALREIQATGPTCVLCGHAGSDSIHHLLPTSRYPDMAGDPANWAPAHGVEGCPVCPPTTSADKRRDGQPQRCNQRQGNSLTPKLQSPRSRRW